MKRTNVWSWVCLVSLVCVLGAQAQRPAPVVERPERVRPPVAAEPEAPGESGAGTTLGTAPELSVFSVIKFGGVLKDIAGQPRTGIVGITFALYTDQEGGAPLWLEAQNVQPNAQGRYTVLLGAMQSEGLPLELFASGEARWLGVEVQGEAEQPRIMLVSVPYALKAAEAETLAGRKASDFVLAERLESELREKAETLVRAEVESQTQLTAGGDSSPAITTGPSTFSGNNTTQILRVRQSGSGTGITATAETNAAVLGLTSTGIGMRGRSNNASGFGIGVLGDTESVSGTGVWGQALNTFGAPIGVKGLVASPTGTAGLFQSINPSGKILRGIVGSGGGSEVFSVGGDGTVTAVHFEGDGSGLTGVASGTGGVENTGSTTIGADTDSDGVGEIVLQTRRNTRIIVKNDGNVGIGTLTPSAKLDIAGDLRLVNSSGGTAGVFQNINSAGKILRGLSGPGSGTEVLSVDGNGVKGVGGGSASMLASTRPIGVWGDNTGSGPGILATNSASETTLEVQNRTTGSAFLIAAFDENDVARFTVDMDGNLIASGTKSASIPLANGKRVAMFAMESPENWFEDFGNGRLVDGEAVISLDPVFVQTVNMGISYHVFVTPNGDCQGLSVTEKKPSGFTVRELGNGRSNVVFDYRIVARRKGYEAVRMPVLKPGLQLPAPSSARIVPGN